MESSVSPKVIASTVGAALASIIWILVAVIWPDTFTETQIAALTGASTTVLAFILGWIIADPLRRRGAQALPTGANVTYTSGTTTNAGSGVDPTSPESQ